MKQEDGAVGIPTPALPKAASDSITSSRGEGVRAAGNSAPPSLQVGETGFDWDQACRCNGEEDDPWPPSSSWPGSPRLSRSSGVGNDGIAGATSPQWLSLLLPAFP